jgi:PAS domain S-box-containing protein
LSIIEAANTSYSAKVSEVLNQRNVFIKLCFLTICTTTIAIPTSIFWGGLSLLVPTLGFTGIISLVLFLLKRRQAQLNLMVLLYAISSTILLLHLQYILGYSFGFYYFGINTLIVVVLVLSKENKGLLISCIAMSLLVIFSPIWFPVVFDKPPFSIAESERVINLFSLFICGITAVVWMVVFHNTMQKHAVLLVEQNEELRSQDVKLRLILDISESGIILIDQEYILIDINAQGKQLLAQIGAAEVNIGDNILDVFVDKPILRAAWRRRLSIAFTGESRAYSDSFEGIRKLYYHIKIEPVDYTGKRKAAIFTTDVTRQEVLSHKQEQITEQLALFVEASDDGYWDWNLETNEITFSDRFMELLGYSPTELPATLSMWESLMLPHDWLEFQQLLTEYKSGRRRELFQIQRYYHKKGHIAHMECRTTKLTNTKGGVIRLIGSTNDITSRKNFEDELKSQYNNLLKINYELDRFVYSVSHDLRAPISSMLGLLNLVKEESNPAVLSHYFGMMRESINRLDKFIKDIQDYSANARHEIEREEVDIKALASAAYRAQNHLPNQERLEVQMEVKGNAKLFTDYTRLRSIVWNIIANSILYQRSNGKPKLLIKAFILKDKISLNFIDNGQGIEEEHLDKVFRMFYRASENSKGSGLGLYIVHEAVKRLGGSINIYSKPGEGTTVNLDLPNHYEQAMGLAESELPAISATTDVPVDNSTKTS